MAPLWLLYGSFMAPYTPWEDLGIDSMLESETDGSDAFVEVWQSHKLSIRMLPRYLPLLFLVGGLKWPCREQ